MDSFTQRIEAEDTPDTGEFSPYTQNSVHSDHNRLVINEELHDLEEDVSGVRVSQSAKREPLFLGPEIIQRLSVFEEVEYGGTVTFECQCRAFPVPISKWYKDDVELVEFNDRVRIEDQLETDGTMRLIIKNVKKSDEGAYRCKLENQEGVAATTGYLSVTGTPSPKSEHAVSTPPLLRAITEESNASHELAQDESTPLEKILAGEYDITSLPFSHYLDLLKDSQTTPSADILVPDANNGSRIPTEAAFPSFDNVPYVSATFGDNEFSVSSGNETSNLGVDLVDVETTYFPDSEKVKAEENVNQFGNLETAAEAIQVDLEGTTPLKESSEGVFDVEQNALAHADAKPKDEAIVPEFESQTLNITEEKEREHWIGGEGKGEILKDVSAEMPIIASLDEEKLKETVIFGRMGVPTDWEFAHYTPETDEPVVQPTPPSFDEKQDIWIENEATSRLEEEPDTFNLRQNEETKELLQDKTWEVIQHEELSKSKEDEETMELVQDKTPEPIHGEDVSKSEQDEGTRKLIEDKISEMIQETMKQIQDKIPELIQDEASKFKQDEETLMLKNDSLKTDDEATPTLKEEAPSSFDDASMTDLKKPLHISESDSSVESKPEVKEISINGEDGLQGFVNGNFQFSDSEAKVSDVDIPATIIRKSDLEASLPSGNGAAMSLISQEDLGVSESIQLPSVEPKQEISDLTDVKSKVVGSMAGLVSGVSSLIDWTSKSTTPEEVQAELSRDTNDSGDQLKKSKDEKGFSFMNLLPDITPTVAAITDWIPEMTSVSPNLPDVPAMADWEATATETQETEVRFVPFGQEDQSAIDWFVGWFRWPWLFYVILALLMTVIASATEMNPALVILIVAFFSLLGFRLFPIDVDEKETTQP